ncbi:MAG: hypothetical protein KVP17_003486 [Porospora cf. gigantea B]|uniref:uncharacterized protein n=1 Tax=Porospora cf. gigantea B TaxID=2853592 RepID=UPI003571A4A3|nr:MAG: hypothetical protein KVP17_003486 [Porospora cf. gigantea B]
MSVLSALEKVRQLKAGTVSALDAFVDTHESNLVTVTEEEYMASMRDNDFIVDEDGGDYAAGDEVELYSSDEAETQPRKKVKLSNNGTLFKHFDKMRSRRTEQVVSLDEEMEEFDQAIREPETKNHSPPRASRKLFGRSNLAQLKVDRGLFIRRGPNVSDPKPSSQHSSPIRPWAHIHN